MARRALTFLITAGPTAEDLDPVRFLTNRATGRLGFETSRAALSAGHRAVLVHGPVEQALIDALPRNGRLKRVPVRSAAQMHAAVQAAARRAAVVVMTAAVADFTPAKTSATKLKKAKSGLTLKLKPTVDILAALGKAKRAGRLRAALIGFALESGSGRGAQRMRTRLSEARRKLATKHLDAIVLDTPAAMGADRAVFRVLHARDGRVEVVRASKKAFAKRLVKLGEALKGPAGKR